MHEFAGQQQPKSTSFYQHPEECYVCKGFSTDEECRKKSLKRYKKYYERIQN
jgi:hypothetical protein